MKNGKSSLPRQRAMYCAIAAIGIAAAMPAAAESEIEALKRELAEQKQLIQKLMAAQEQQTRTTAKLEAQASTAGSGATPSATAIPGVTFYGTADVNIARVNSGLGTKTVFGTGGMTASSLGVKGQRELGNGLRAVGEVEAGISFTTGVVANGPVTNGLNLTSASSGGLLGTGNQIFSRQAYAGLASDNLGTLTIGRQYTGSYATAAVFGTAMGPGLFGASGSFLPVIGGMPTRMNNSLVYRTPTLNGFSGHFSYTVGSENNINSNTVVGATTTTDRAGAGWDLAMFYRSGPLTAAFTTWNMLNTSFVTAGETDLAKKSGAQGVVNYDFGIVKLYGTVVSGKISGGNYENITKTLSNASGSSVSASMPFGKSALIASYAKLDDKSLLNKSGNLVGLAYTYELYKNTKLYGSWGKLRNNANATYSLADAGDLVGNVVTPGTAATGIMAGVNTSF